MEMLMQRYVNQLKNRTRSHYNPLEKVTHYYKLIEAKEYDGSDEHQFAVELVAEIDDNISSIDGEISKDTRSGKTTGKRLGVQIVLPDNKRIAFACLLYTSPSPRDATLSRMPSSA